jgi:hypothetical protein
MRPLRERREENAKEEQKLRDHGVRFSVVGRSLAGVHKRGRSPRVVPDAPGGTVRAGLGISAHAFLPIR